MEPGKVFVLILTAFAVGILAFLEVRSRRSRRADESRQKTDQNP
jgi:hypothetical protein